MRRRWFLLDDFFHSFGPEYHFGAKGLPKDKSGLFAFPYIHQRASVLRRIHCTLVIDFGVAIPYRIHHSTSCFLGRRRRRRRYTRKITHLDLLYTLLQIEINFICASPHFSTLTHWGLDSSLVDSASIRVRASIMVCSSMQACAARLDALPRTATSQLTTTESNNILFSLHQSAQSLCVSSRWYSWPCFNSCSMAKAVKALIPLPSMIDAEESKRYTLAYLAKPPTWSSPPRDELPMDRASIVSCSCLLGLVLCIARCCATCVVFRHLFNIKAPE